jgi:uracil-DNA glycosylase
VQAATEPPRDSTSLYGNDPVVAALEALRIEAESCERCLLADTRTRVVFGEGDPHSDLMFVGEAPGYHEDQQGRPFVGQAGKLLEQLLAEIGLAREQVYIANVLKSRPPNNRDPRPEEIDACRPFLIKQIELIAPRVICTLGNFATKLLSGSQTGITRVHGSPQRTRIAGREVYLYPIFHPAAALYTPAMLATLKSDVLRLPEVLALPLGDEAEVCLLPTADAGPDDQMGLGGLGRASHGPGAEGGGHDVPMPPPAETGPAEQLGLF